MTETFIAFIAQNIVLVVMFWIICKMFKEIKDLIEKQGGSK